MAEAGRFRLRIRYQKLGRLCYLSHLEVFRAMMRVIRRSGLDYAVSEGFSPHMKAAASTALPVGCVGLDEYIDVHLREYVPRERALAALQGACAESLIVVDCGYVPSDAPALQAGYPVMLYEALLAVPASACEPQGLSQRDVILQGLEGLLTRGFITVERPKKKPRQIDLSQKLVGVLDVRDVPDVRGAAGGAQGELALAGAEAIIPAAGHAHLAQVSFMTISDNSGALRPDIFLGAWAEGTQGGFEVLLVAHVASFAKASSNPRVGEPLLVDAAGEGRCL